MRTHGTGRQAALKCAGMGMVIVLCVMAFGSRSAAQEAIDLRELLRETQKTSREPKEITVVWWMPLEFWQASAARNPQADPAKIEALLQIMRRYTVVAISDGTVGPFGGVTYTSEETIRRSVTVKDAAGKTLFPLDELDVDVDTTNLLQMLKPVLSNILGPLGQNTHFVLFPGKTPEGRAVADARGTGTFTVVFRQSDYLYRLPLGSVLPRNYDPKTGEAFPGNYLYNPFTGGALASKPSAN